jgi:glucokinase
MTIDFNGRECHCGKKGCLQAYASIDGIYFSLTERFPEIIRKYSEQVENMKLRQSVRGLKNENEKLKLIAYLYSHAQEQQIKDYFDELAEMIASAFSNFISLVSPHIVFYGGRIVEEVEGLIDSAIAKTGKLFPVNSPDYFEGIRFIKSTIDDKAVIRGAGFLAYNYYFRFLDAEYSKVPVAEKL